MNTKNNCGSDKAKITVKVSRKSSTQEWVVRTRNEGALVGEYFTDDKQDANNTACFIYKEWDSKGFATEIKLA